jgi:hypothetical protein
MCAPRLCRYGFPSSSDKRRWAGYRSGHPISRSAGPVPTILEHLASSLNALAREAAAHPHAPPRPSEQTDRISG